MLRSGFPALAVCALSVVLSACGSDDDSDPVAGNMTLSATEDKAVQASLDFSGGGGAALTGTILLAPTKGTAVFSGGSPLVLTYTPNPNENGVDVFTYTVSDGSKTSNVGNVAVSIAAVDDVPVIQPTLTTNEDTSVTAVLITDIDSTFTSSITVAPTNGTLTVDASNAGKFTYVPNADFNGTDSAELTASYVIADGTTATTKGTVTITVNPAPPPGGTAPIKTLSYDPPGFELSLGDSIRSVTTAESAPITFYLTQSGSLYRVDESTPDGVQQVARGTRINEFSIDATGLKLAYTEGTVLKLVDFAEPETTRDLATNARSPYLSPSGSRVFYTDSGAPSVVTANSAPVKRQITPYVASPDLLGPVIRVSPEEDSVFYSVSFGGGDPQVMSVDPDVPFSNFAIGQKR